MFFYSLHVLYHSVGAWEMLHFLSLMTELKSCFYVSPWFIDILLLNLRFCFRFLFLFRTNTVKVYMATFHLYWLRKTQMPLCTIFQTRARPWVEPPTFRKSAESLHHVKKKSKSLEGFEPTEQWGAMWF